LYAFYPSTISRSYLISVLDEDVQLLLAEVAHRDALDLVSHLAVDACAGGAHEHAKVHHCICRSLARVRWSGYLLVAVEALAVLW